MSIHKEGYLILLISITILSIPNFLVHYFLPDFLWLQNIILLASIIFFLLILQFFRNPKRNTIVNPKHIIAPADGKVVVIEENFEEEYLKVKRRQISIFMSPLNVHVNRNPVEGLVKYIKYHEGKYLVAWHPKSSTENERNTVVYQTKQGIDILIRQIAGAMARRICCYLNTTQAVKQGAEMGFIKFGSRVDIFLPLDAEIKVNLGDKTKAGESILAILK